MSMCHCVRVLRVCRPSAGSAQPRSGGKLFRRWRLDEPIGGEDVIRTAVWSWTSPPHSFESRKIVSGGIEPNGMWAPPQRRTTLTA